MYLLEPGQLSLLSSWSRQMSSKLHLEAHHLNQWRRHLVNGFEVKTQAWQKVMAAYRRDVFKITPVG